MNTNRGRGGGGGGGWRGGGNRGCGSFNNTNESVDSYSGSQTITDCPFRKWLQYLPGEQYSPTSNLVHCLQAVKQFFLKSTNLENSEELHEKRFFDVNLKLLIEDPGVLQAWPLLKEDLEDRAEKVSGILGLTRHQMIEDELQNDGGGVTKAFPMVRARLTKHSPSTPLKMLKSSYFGKLVTIRGTVIRVSSIRPMCAWMEFQCPICLADQVVHQPEGKHTAPSRCCGAGCRQYKNFVPKRASKKTITVDLQNIRLQEIVQDDGGRVPRTIECELTEDLCDNCVPGDVIILTGVVKVVSSEEGNSKQPKAKSKTMFILFISALNISNSRSKGSRGSNNIGIEFTNNDYAAIQEIHTFGDSIFKLLTNSLSPSIYGHELVKAGLLLGLFGGTNKSAGDRTHLSIRGDPHILVVGDPGLGKSQMLQSTSAVAPRGVFVTGNTTTTSGLTVTLTREACNDFALEAGALVLADQGCCCIDEFDKMTTQHQALLEAMEQQCISVAKAGVVCTLPARTAILAAANPVGGHYNRSKTVAENLKLGPALLSRFDLVFILIDTPNEQMDGLLSEHVMALHLPQNTTKKSTFLDPTQQPHTISASAPLADRLKYKAGETKEPIPHPILRKYIAYARKYVFPKLSKEACNVLQNFYLELRQKHQTSDSTPITTRQLESLIRLTEARAKLQLCEEATVQDALDVVEIMKLSMVDTFSDNTGLLDFSRDLNGSGMSSKNAAKNFIAALTRQSHNLQKNTFTVDEMKKFAQMSAIKVDNFSDFVASLNYQGFMIKKSDKIYQLLSAD